MQRKEETAREKEDGASRDEVSGLKWFPHPTLRLHVPSVTGHLSRLDTSALTVNDIVSNILSFHAEKEEECNESNNECVLCHSEAFIALERGLTIIIDGLRHKQNKFNIDVLDRDLHTQQEEQLHHWTKEGSVEKRVESGLLAPEVVKLDPA
ncbi:hypothetical protein WN55_03810 [Dufourea novaeangliae]|uniref:Uncharacterized protein n=1 Tax=Dufourea novaeangliae TaxID=178035 RepID=A0A154PIU3_DUFNO|nr:hypothetical protein WN55_03810 [Dufourea novaeangliae]